MPRTPRYDLSHFDHVFHLTFFQGYDRAVEQSLDAIRAKVNWLKRDQEDVETWLNKNQYLQSKL